MYAAATGGAQNALASIDVPMGGTLEGLEWCCSDDCDADNDVASWQISFGSTHAINNDARQVISNCKNSVQLTTSGSPNTSSNYYVDLDLPVAAGERIYLHRLATASLTGEAQAVLHFSFSVPGARR
jgi:hypothetical protein